MNNNQSYPFMLYPSSWSAPSQPVLGAVAMHRELRRWLVELGQIEHAAPVSEPDRSDERVAEGELLHA